MLYFVVGRYDPKCNVLNVIVYQKGQDLGEFQVPIQGLDLRDRHPLVFEQALRDIVKNRLIQFTQLSDAFERGAEPEVDLDYPFMGKTGPLFYTFTPINSRITIHLQES